VITKRTLENWRKDALKGISSIKGVEVKDLNISVVLEQQLNDRILRLTQDLIDLQLMKKG
jgi:hypothetical protein